MRVRDYFKVPIVFWVGWLLAALLAPAAIVLVAPAPAAWAVATGLAVLGIGGAAQVWRRAVMVRRRAARARQLPAIDWPDARCRNALHDVIGLGLSAIVLKVELANRMVGRDDNRVRNELGEVLDIARRSIADVRGLSRGESPLSLTAEVTAIRGVLASLGVKVVVHIGPVTVDDAVDRELAIVLREAVTNLLRHSKARHCHIRLRQVGGRVRLSVSNDGAGASAMCSTGTGLYNLKRRMVALGGALMTERDRGSFRLVAECPAVTPASRHRARSERRRVDYAR